MSHAAPQVIRFLTIGVVLSAVFSSLALGNPLPEVIQATQPKLVKIYGAGGYRGLEAYQSGFLISPTGHVLTVWSYVLDTDALNVTLNDGRKFNAKLVGHDPRLEIAVLKIDSQDLPHFKLSESVNINIASRVLAFSNLYNVATGNEPVSVLKGIVSAKTNLKARRGAFETTYDGPVYVLDAMTNNPGASGGALTDHRGNLSALLGKELRDSQNNIWLNYGIPIEELLPAVDNIIAGRTVPPLPKESLLPAEPLSLDLLGVVLVPNVLDRTPPFVDVIESGSPAEDAGLRPDDLILFVGEHVVQSCRIFREQLSLIDREDEITLTIQRGQDLIDITMRARP